MPASRRAKKTMVDRRARSRSIRGAALGISVVVLASMLGVVADTAAGNPATAAQDPTVCNDSVALVNGGFEQPKVTAGSYATLAQDQVPGWDTTDVQGRIEIWSNGFQGVPATEGTQFAELNAFSASRLSQDVSTAPGQTLSWSLRHRGRNGTDVMRVLIGPPGAPVQSGPDISDGQTWGTRTGTYVVPAGQTTTRLAFEAVSAAGGNPAVGNLLDDITFGTGPCLITDKTVENRTSGAAQAEVGDVLRYTVTSENGGGTPALESVSTDTLPPGLDFVPGSLRIVSGAGTAALTDVPGDDRGEYSDADRTVRVRIGALATPTTGGTMLPGESTVYSFDARVNIDGAATTIENEAQVSFLDGVAGEGRTSTSQTTATPVGDAADLQVTKTLDTSPVVAGEPVTFTVTAVNNGPQASGGVTVLDTLPVGLSDVRAESTGGDCVVTTASVMCAGVSLGVGDTEVLTVTGIVSADAIPGSGLVNTVRINSPTTDPDSSNNIATASGTVSTAADVSITKTFDPVSPIAGEEVEYTLVGTNSGPSEARDVVLTDPLDGATTFVSAESPAGPCTFDGIAVSCAIGTLAPDASADVTITVVLAPDAAAAVQNTATITTSTSDIDPEDNASSTSFDPTIIADLALTKSASASTVTAGDTLVYTIDVENAGPSDAENAVLTDTVPDGITVQNVVAPAGATCTTSGRSVRCNWALLEPGVPSTVEVRTVVEADAPAGSVINTASVAAPADDADTTNNSDSATITIEQNADLGIEKVATPTAGVPGTEQTFTIAVTNHGPSVARSVTVADALPVELRDPTTTGDCALFGRVLGCLAGDLAVGATYTVTIVGTLSPDAAGSITNTATTSSATPDPNPENYSDSVTVPLAPLADVSVSKTTSTPQVVIDGDVEYIVTVRNDGPSTAAGVVVTDVVDDGIALMDAVASTGTWSGNIWSVGELQPGDEESIIIAGVATATGAFMNTATVSSDAADPDADDLTSTAEVTVAAVAEPQIALEKTGGDFVDADGDTAVSAGDTVKFRFVVTNTGTVPLTGVEIDDPKLGGAVPCDIPDLTAGESSACGPVTYAITESEASARAVVNAATVSAVSGVIVVTTSDSVTVPLPELALTGGIVTGLGWAILLIVLGLLAVLIAQVRRARLH